MIRHVYLDKREAGFNTDHYGNSFFFYTHSELSTGMKVKRVHIDTLF